MSTIVTTTCLGFGANQDLPFWKISYFIFLSSKTVVKNSNSFSLQTINILELEKYHIPLFNNKLSKPPVILKAEFWCHFLKKKKSML